MYDVAMVPGELRIWIDEFKLQVQMLKRMRKFTPEERAEVAAEYAEAAEELARLAGEVVHA